EVGSDPLARAGDAEWGPPGGRAEPLVVVDVVADPDRRVWNPPRVEEEVEDLAPDRLARDADRAQDLGGMDADLHPDEPLAQLRRDVVVAVGSVGDGKEQEARRSRVEAQPPREAGDLQVGRVDLSGVVAADVGVVHAAGGGLVLVDPAESEA